MMMATAQRLDQLVDLVVGGLAVVAGDARVDALRAGGWRPAPPPLAAPRSRHAHTRWCPSAWPRRCGRREGARPGARARSPLGADRSRSSCSCRARPGRRERVATSRGRPARRPPRSPPARRRPSIAAEEVAGVDDGSSDPPGRTPRPAAARWRRRAPRPPRARRSAAPASASAIELDPHRARPPAHDLGAVGVRHRLQLDLHLLGDAPQRVVVDGVWPVAPQRDVHDRDVVDLDRLDDPAGRPPAARGPCSSGSCCRS